jgi:hypothetical protein
VFFVYGAIHKDKGSGTKLNEKIVENDPNKYIFVPILFGKQPVLGPQGTVLGCENKAEQQISLYNYDS